MIVCLDGVVLGTERCVLIFCLIDVMLRTNSTGISNLRQFYLIFSIPFHQVWRHRYLQRHIHPSNLQSDTSDWHMRWMCAWQEPIGRWGIYLPWMAVPSYSALDIRSIREGWCNIHPYIHYISSPSHTVHSTRSLGMSYAISRTYLPTLLTSNRFTEEETSLINQSNQPSSTSHHTTPHHDI